jgi:hypothetical protein
MVSTLDVKIDSLRARLEAVGMPSDPALALLVDQIDQQVDYLRGVLSAISAALSPPDVVEGISGDLDNAEAAFVDFQAMPAIDRLEPARVALWHAISRSGSLPTIIPSRETLRKAAARGRDVFREAARESEERFAALVASQAELEGRLANIEGAIDLAAKEVEQRVAASLEPLEQRVNQVAATLAAQETRISTVATDQIQAGSKAEAARVEQFTATINQLTDDHRLFMEAERARAEENAMAVLTVTNNLVQQTRTHEETAGRLAAGAADKAVSGGFLEDFRQHRRAGWVFLLLGALCLAAAAAFGFWAIEIRGESVTSLEFLAGRILVTLPIVGLAVYLLREAGRHRDQAAQAKSLHLDHQAFAPYISLEVDETKKSDLRKEMAERAFFRERASLDKSEPDYVAKLVDAAAEAVKSLAKRS